MKCAVIGASSFSGRAFCRRLRAVGWIVAEFSRPQYDLSRPEMIVKDIARERIPFVVNFAALNVVADSWKHAQDYYRTNVIGISRLADLLVNADFLEKFVQVSTPEVYGPSALHHEFGESRTYIPSTPYAVSRAAADMHLHALHALTGFPVCFTRSVNVYGIGQQLYRVIPKTVLKVHRGEKLMLEGGGKSTRSFIHIDDVVAATMLVMRFGKPGDIYHTSTPEQTSIRALVTRICGLLGADPEKVCEDVPDRPGKDMAYQLSSTKIRSELGWTDTITLEDGLPEVVAWYRDHAEEFYGRPLEYLHAA